MTLDCFEVMMWSTTDWIPGFWLAMGIHQSEYKVMCYTSILLVSLVLAAVAPAGKDE